MKIARVSGTITATVKDSSFSGITLLYVDVEDGKGAVLERAVVAADTCSAGVGDTVLLATGSAARLPSKVAGIPVDATVVAVVDHIDIESSRRASSSGRKN